MIQSFMKDRIGPGAPGLSRGEGIPMRQGAACPQGERLTGLVNGSLSKREEEAIERHLWVCESCQSRVEKIAYDEEGSPRTIPCPDRLIVQRLVAGTLGSYAAEAVEHHVSTCEACATLYEAIGNEEEVEPTTTPCPAPSVLKRLLTGALPADEQQDIERHLSECEPCQSRLDALAGGDGTWPGQVKGLSKHRTAAAPGLKRVMGILKDDPGPDPDATGYAYMPANVGEVLGYLDPPEAPGDLGKLGAYRILQVLGQGCMGTVLKAFDPVLSRTVAIKVLAPQLAASSSARQRFAREARAAAAIRDDHVVAIHSVDEWKGLPYLVMEFIPGGSLQERLDRSAPLDVTSILRIGVQAASGLAAAHAQGLVHRDVKPSNILLENCVERVKISDFSLARAVDDASLTQSGVAAGTPLFMAPEQARCETIDHRADLFSLGAVLYVMCTGRSPFRASTTLGVLRRVCDDAHRPVREVNPDVPEWLAAIVDRLLAKDREDRFQTASEVARVLEDHLSRRQRGIDDDGATGLQVQHAALIEEIGPAKQPKRRRTFWRTFAYVLLVFFGLSFAGLFVAAVVVRIFPQSSQLAIFNPYRDFEVLIDGTPVGQGVDGILSSFDVGVQSCVVDVYKGKQRIQHKVIALGRGMTVECEISQDGELRIMHEGPVRDPRPWWRWRRGNLFGKTDPNSPALAGGMAEQQPERDTRASILARLNLANVDREEAKSALERAKVLHANAEAVLHVRRNDFRRLATLAASNAIPVGELEKGQGQMIAATKDLEAANAAATEAEAVLREAELRAAEAQAQLDAASGHESDHGVQETIHEYPKRRAVNEVARTTAQLARTKALYDKAIALIEHERKQLERLEQLHQNNAIPVRTLHEAEERVLTLESQRDLAKLEVSKAEAQLKTAQEAHRGLAGAGDPGGAPPASLSPSEIELTEAETALRSANAARERRVEELHRTKTLFDQRDVSRAELDEGEMNAAVAAAEASEADARLAEVRAQVKAREIEARQARNGKQIPGTNLLESGSLDREHLAAERDIAAARAARVRAALQKAVAECKYLGNQHERLKKLHQSRAVAAHDVESARAALGTADARRRVTQADLEHAELELKAAEERAGRRPKAENRSD
jgi:multidrug resistance efflux pump